MSDEIKATEYLIDYTIRFKKAAQEVLAGRLLHHASFDATEEIVFWITRNTST